MADAGSVALVELYAVGLQSSALAPRLGEAGTGTARVREYVRGQSGVTQIVREPGGHVWIIGNDVPAIRLRAAVIAWEVMA